MSCPLARLASPADDATHVGNLYPKTTPPKPPGAPEWARQGSPRKKEMRRRRGGRKWGPGVHPFAYSFEFSAFVGLDVAGGGGGGGGGRCLGNREL